MGAIWADPTTLDAAQPVSAMPAASANVDEKIEFELTDNMMSTPSVSPNEPAANENGTPKHKSAKSLSTSTAAKKSVGRSPSLPRQVRRGRPP